MSPTSPMSFRRTFAERGAGEIGNVLLQRRRRRKEQDSYRSRRSAWQTRVRRPAPRGETVNVELFPAQRRAFPLNNELRSGGASCAAACVGLGASGKERKFFSMEVLLFIVCSEAIGCGSGRGHQLRSAAFVLLHELRLISRYPLPPSSFAGEHGVHGVDVHPDIGGLIGKERVELLFCRPRSSYRAFPQCAASSR